MKAFTSLFVLYKSLFDLIVGISPFTGGKLLDELEFDIEVPSTFLRSQAYYNSDSLTWSI